MKRGQQEIYDHEQVSISSLIVEWKGISGVLVTASFPTVPWRRRGIPFIVGRFLYKRGQTAQALLVIVNFPFYEKNAILSVHPEKWCIHRPEILIYFIYLLTWSLMVLRYFTKTYLNWARAKIWRGKNRANATYYLTRSPASERLEQAKAILHSFCHVVFPQLTCRKSYWQACPL